MHEPAVLQQEADLADLAELSGLQWVPLAFKELPELSGLLTAIEHMDESADAHSLERLEEAHRGAQEPPEEHAAIGRLPGGQAVAYAWNYVEPDDVSPRRVFLTGGVHPGFRGRGIGRAVLDWQMGRARRYDAMTRRAEHGPLQQICFVDDHLSDHRSILTRAGFTPARWSVDMSMVFDEAPVPPDEGDQPAGVELIRYEPTFSDEVRQCHNHCWAAQPMARPVSPESWERSLTRDSFHPEWSWCARDLETGEIVGYALNSGYEQDWSAQGYSEGWTDRLGVLPDRRGRGIAVALLLRSMASFRQAGLDGAGLGVDFFDESDGRGLYERVGFRPSRTTIMYELTAP